MDNEELEGLKGWLLLVGFSVIMSPVALALSTWPLYSDIVNQGILAALINPDSAYYQPLLALFIVLEMVINLALFFACLYLILLFFRKHFLFPKYFIFILLINIAFILVDALLGHFLIPEVAMFDQETIFSLVRLIIAASIWIPYMLISERVEVTFTRHKPINKEITTSTEEA